MLEISSDDKTLLYAKISQIVDDAGSPAFDPPIFLALDDRLSLPVVDPEPDAVPLNLPETLLPFLVNPIILTPLAESEPTVNLNDASEYASYEILLYFVIIANCVASFVP